MSFGDAFLTATRNTAGGEKIANIIEFVDSVWGLGGSTFRLFPVQRVILKATYGIALEDEEPTVPVWGDLSTRDGWREGWRREHKHMLTEAEYLRYLYETGRCNVSEIIPGRERREMVLSVGRRSGKCIAGDSLVVTEQGMFRIDELGDPDGPEVQPLDLGVAQESGRTARSRYFYNAGVHPVIKVRTHCGYEIRGTAKHRIKVMDTDGEVRWRYLPDIELGDQIAINRSTQLWASEYVDARPFHNEEGRKEVALPAYIDERWGLLLGCLVGDGLWGYENRTELTVSDPEFIEQARALFTELLGGYTTAWDLRREHTGQIKFSGKCLRRFLHDIGFRMDLTRDTKCVPWSILRSPSSVVRSFLRGLFETDGGVEKGGQVVSFSTASQQLAREVQLLLLNLGIISRVRPKWDKGYQRDYYHLAIRGPRSRTAFAELVGFMTDRKGLPLLASIQSAGREGGNAESIPHQRGWARRLLESIPRANPGHGWSRSSLRSKLGNTIKPSASDEMTYPRLNAVLETAADLGADPSTIAHFEHLRDLDYFYDPVKTIEHGEEPVFDLNVPDGEAFVANGMTNHNTFMSACIAAYETYKLISKLNPQGFYGLPETDIIQLISVATDKDQAGILFQGVSGHFNNCFASGTEIITDEGIRPIGPLAGTTQTLLTANGSWVKAPIRSFGRQKLFKLTLSRQGVDDVIYTTADHRWYARDSRSSHRGKGYVEFRTTELRPGKHHLQQVYGRSYKNRIDASPFGVAHGFAFGDGTCVPGERNANRVHLFGEKDAALRPYFEMCPSHPVSGGEQRTALPNFFKEYPSIRENKAYLLGWLKGYFAADGSVGKQGQIKIDSARRSDVEFVRDVCALLGIGTYSIQSYERESNLTGSSSVMHRITFQRETLDASFFIIDAHRDNFVSCGGSEVKRHAHWTVKAVEETDRVEEVFCATVEGHGTFALAGNIVTGNCDFFRPYLANNTQSYVRFQTPSDVERFGPFAEHQNPNSATIKVTFKSCVAKGLRGAGNICIILDEFAHFTDGTQSSAKTIYDAVRPSLSAFTAKDPDTKQPVNPDDPSEGRMIMISSPLGRQGKFYEQFQRGFAGGVDSDNILSIQAPTWEVNPTLAPGEFAGNYASDTVTFYTEYGGEFTDATRGWIRNSADLLRCIEPTLRPRTSAPARTPHFMGLDFALQNDATAVAIGHLDSDGRIVVDLVDKIVAGEGRYSDFEGRLDFDAVADWVHNLCRKFLITEGMFDQWCGIAFEQALAKRGLSQLKKHDFTRPLTSQVFKNFKDMMFEQRIQLYNWPVPDDGREHCEYIEELLTLQETVHNKYTSSVEAPQTKGFHDDQSDALVRMVWLASQNAGKFATFGRSTGNGRNKGRAKVSGNVFAGGDLRNSMQRRLGGSHPSRMPGLYKRKG